MKKLRLLHVQFCMLLLFSSCGDSTGSTVVMPNLELPNVTIQNAMLIEQDEAIDMNFEFRLSVASENSITLSYQLVGLTAEPGVDFVSQDGEISFAAGETSKKIAVTILPDDIREVDETFQVNTIRASGAEIPDATALGIIVDNDDVSFSTDANGYFTPDAHYGYSIFWQDEFEGDALNLNDYNFDIGDGCPNICGWGNNELEEYTNSQENINLADGKLVITATDNHDKFESAKIHTKDKQEFKFGRIDVRAKLPEGQGIWPAVWMLGENIDEVGWPACGEIDIMELVGHKPSTSHGTAHWGPQGGPSTNKGSSYSNSGKFSEQFHVFSIIWKTNEIVWYVDEEKFFTLTPSVLGNAAWRFNQPFYLIFNVAIGGNWPGDPDDTTQFPQQMEIDYVRVFQRS